MKRIASALVLTALVLTVSAATAQAPPAGFRGDFLAQQDGVEKEILGLAEATPAEQNELRRKMEDLAASLERDDLEVVSPCARQP